MTAAAPADPAAAALPEPSAGHGGGHLPEHVEIAIVGAGFSGIGLAIRLIDKGIRNFVLLERGTDVGGTWRDNTYPGCACDIPSHLYSLSYAPNPEWSRYFASQPEIHDYVRRITADRGVSPHLRLGQTVTAAVWDDATGCWEVTTERGRLMARHLVLATGALSEPTIPAIPGLADFAGRAFHSARWDHDHDLSGRRVAVIGTGASGVQIVPAIQPIVARQSVFMREIPWVLPRPDRTIPRWQQALMHVPPARLAVRGALYGLHELFVPALLGDDFWLRQAESAAREHLNRQVPDPALRARLTPRTRLGCQRVINSSDFYPALGTDNTDLVTDPITQVVAEGVVTSDGRLHEVDTIVFATGFRVANHPMGDMVTGSGGRTLAEVWDGSPRAYRGTHVAGFPNLHLMTGPNTGLGHNSVLLMIEAQVEYVVRFLTGLRRRGLPVVEVDGAAQAWDVAEIDARMRSTVWLNGDCTSWYLDRHGRNSTLWPGWVGGFRRRLREIDWGAYRLGDVTGQGQATLRTGSASARSRVSTP